VSAAEAVQTVIPGLALADQAEAVQHYRLMVDRHYAPLLRYLTRQTGDPELAANVTQDAFLAAYRRYDQLRDGTAFAGWLYQIARNLLRMEFRRRRLRRIVSLDWLTCQGGETAAVFRRPDAAGSTEEQDEIQRALGELSPVLREALLLHSLCGFSGGEVAGILGITPAAARKRICRAEAAFRARFPTEDDGHRDSR
jgi:RNA polymerase sigma-70 factor (ECF subfamily)